MLKIEDILREDFDWENVEIDENEFDELENQLIINYLFQTLQKKDNFQQQIGTLIILRKLSNGQQNSLILTREQLYSYIGI